MYSYIKRWQETSQQFEAAAVKKRKAIHILVVLLLNNQSRLLLLAYLGDKGRTQHETYVTLLKFFCDRGL